MSNIPITHQGPDDGGNYEIGWEDDYLSAHVISDVGKKREHNEDSCLLCAPVDTAMAERGFVFCVADGMGGASAGELASHLAINNFTKEFYAGQLHSIPSHIMQSIESANRQIYDEAEENPEYHGMGTTLSSMVVHGDSGYIGHVGDSRVYILREGLGLQQLTHDHSLVAEQVRNGVISEEEAHNHLFKNLITRAVGIKPTVEVDLYSVKLQKGDTLLLCSDGLCGLVEDPDIEQGLKLDSLQGAARLLVGKALDAGGIDNVTVTVIRVTDVPPRTELQQGCDEVVASPKGIVDRIKGLFG
ncbi:MAG: serine/threonine protein phosphatase [Candidatus Hydrogenedentota bacterium]|nr:MAG: serine/threonine protein phosphatase [Candidatus Hydrogenedentota bacterium]